MPYPITNNLTQIKQLMNEGKFREAMKIINQFEDKKGFSLQDKFELHYLNGSLFLELGYIEIEIKFEDGTEKEYNREN